MAKHHRKPVEPSVVDPAARATKRAYGALSASTAGLELGISVALGLLLGYWLDSKAGTGPWLMLLFMVFGLVAGFRGVLRAIKRAEQADS
jgi:F0F1-type ATP synthase assembly protein I